MTNEEQFADLKQFITATVRGEISEALLSVNHRVDGVESSLEQTIAHAQSSLDQKIAGVQSSLEQKIVDVQSSLERKITDVQTSVDQHRTETRDGFAGVADAIDVIHETLDDHQAVLDRHEQAITGLRTQSAA